MKNLLYCLFFTVLLTTTKGADPGLLRSADLNGLRIKIFSGDEGFSMQAWSLSTGDVFGPTPIYEGLLIEAVLPHINDPIIVNSVEDDSVYVTPPMYSTVVEMKQKDQSKEEKRFNLLDIRIEDLNAQLQILQNRRSETGSVGMSSVNDASYTLHTGSGDRYYRMPVTFSRAFGSAPGVEVSVKSIDADAAYNTRINSWAENVRVDGCDIVTQTWSDSLIYQFEVVWSASEN